MALDQVPDLIRAGVSCFKIEGRLKGPEYVAITVQAYRQAVDTAWEHLLSGNDKLAQPSCQALVDEQQRRALHQVGCLLLVHLPCNIILRIEQYTCCSLQKVCKTS
jgi:collagenase-like PrtC family protease